MPKDPFKLPNIDWSDWILEEPKRDSRRAFTESQKKDILVRQKYRCARCHKLLDLRATHFHHVKPWASGGKTRTANGVALCSECHDKVHHEQRLKKLEGKKRKKKSGIFDIDLSSIL
ncbi:MAG: HNH endonuclease signature motif containing protein [Candidatus Bathyarchaeia archaeon]